jgi:hypothetical protein
MSLGIAAIPLFRSKGAARRFSVELAPNVGHFGRLESRLDGGSLL